MKYEVRGTYKVILDIPDDLDEDAIDDYISDETIDAIAWGSRSDITYDSVREV